MKVIPVTLRVVAWVNCRQRGWRGSVRVVKHNRAAVTTVDDMVGTAAGGQRHTLT